MIWNSTFLQCKLKIFVVNQMQHNYIHKLNSVISTYCRSLQISQTESVEDSGKSLAPNFLRVCTDREATEGKMTRFDCRVTGRPYPEVTWYLNGKQICDDATHKVLVNESGNHALMITNVHRSNAGTVSSAQWNFIPLDLFCLLLWQITCVARNKSGETSFECQLNVVEKEQVVAPKFVERFTTVNVKQGEPVVLTARAVGTPIPRITWQKVRSLLTLKIHSWPCTCHSDMHLLWKCNMYRKTTTTKIIKICWKLILQLKCGD